MVLSDRPARKKGIGIGSEAQLTDARCSAGPGLRVAAALEPQGLAVSLKEGNPAYYFFSGGN